jgi:DNA-binding GntR family transcriptional regulator
MPDRCHCLIRRRTAMPNYHFPTDDSTLAARPAAATRAQQAYETLREEILSGALRPGRRLVRRELGRRLGVSPVPVAEALLRLEIEGLVQSRPLYGCRVRPLTLCDVQNDAVLREAIECQAARLCAERATAQSLSRLAAQARRLDRLMADGQPQSRAGRLAHSEFHLAIARLTSYARLADELQRVWFRRLMWMNWIKATHCKRVPRDWHQRLVEAIAAGDPGEAEARMREHVRYGNEDDQTALRYLLEHNVNDWEDLP